MVEVIVCFNEILLHELFQMLIFTEIWLHREGLEKTRDLRYPVLASDTSEYFNYKFEIEETAIISATFNDFVQHCFKSAQIPPGSGCEPAPGTPLVPGNITLALEIPINWHLPLLPQPQCPAWGSPTEKWWGPHRTNALGSKSRNFSYSFAPYSSPPSAWVWFLTCSQ